MSKLNDDKLVMDTIKKLKRTKKFIFHTDHGSQYSTKNILQILKSIKGKTTMSRLGNSLDNHEIKYLFGCLNGEHLNHINTSKMTFAEIKKEIAWYINWYNKKRIQKRLQWKTPEISSVYAV